jgi:hypothetical protein
MNSLGFVENYVHFDPSEFLGNLSIVSWSTTGWYGQVNSLTYKQLRNFGYFNYLIQIF